MADGESSTMVQQVAEHGMWIKGHEALCAERYKNLDDRLKVVFVVIGTSLMLLIGVTAWSLKTNWDNADRQLQAIEQLRK